VTGVQTCALPIFPGLLLGSSKICGNISITIMDRRKEPLNARISFMPNGAFGRKYKAITAPKNTAIKGSNKLSCIKDL
jgi:hypothetical protein